MTEYVRLGDVAKISSGGTPSRNNPEYWKNGNIPWVKIGDFEGKYISKTSEMISEKGLNNSSAKLFPKGTILYSIFASLGEVGILNIEAATNQAIVGIQFNNNIDIDNDYAYYFFVSLKNLVIDMGRGVAQKNINQSILKEIKIPLPPLSEQQHIVKTLDTASAVIQKRKKQIALLDDLAKSVFVEMFGDTDNQSMLYPIKKLRDLSVKISDGVHAKPDYVSQGRPFLSVININKKKIDFSNCKFVSEDAYQKMIKSTHPEKGDILYTKVGNSYGIPAYVDTDTKFCLYVSVCLIKPNHNLINSKFLAYSMNMPYIKRQADKRIKGIGVPDLHLNQINEFDIIYPPMELQKDFVNRIEKIEKQRILLERGLAKIEEAYGALMQKYFG